MALQGPVAIGERRANTFLQEDLGGLLFLLLRGIKLYVQIIQRRDSSEILYEQGTKLGLR